MMRRVLATKLLSTFVFTRSASWPRYRNLAVVAWEHFVTQPDVVRGRPLRLVVDPSSHCDLRCPLCPTGQGRQDRARGTMSLTHFQRLVDEVGETLFEIDLFGWGEPLLNPALAQMIAYARARGIRTTVSAHLNHLSDAMAEGLVDAGLDRFIVSLDGVSQESYARYRRGGDLSRVLANVTKLRRLRENRRKPKLIWQFLLMRHNVHELASAKQRYAEWGFDAFLARPMRADMGRESEWSDAQRIQRSREFLPENDALSRYDYKTEKRKHALSRCAFLWTQAVIDPRGKVSPCCAIYDEKDDVGELRDTGLLPVWNGAAYQALRRQVRTRDKGIDNACRTCLTQGFVEY